MSTPPYRFFFGCAILSRMTYLLLLKLKQWLNEVVRLVVQNKLAVLGIVLILLALFIGRCGRSVPPTPTVNIESIEKQSQQAEDRERRRLDNTLNSIDNKIKQADDKVKQAGNKKNINAGDLENKLK